MPRVLAFLLLVGVVIRAALPLVAASVLEDLLSSELDARVRIRDVDLGVLEGWVVLVDWELSTRDGAPLARAGRTGVDLDWGALLRSRLEAERLVVDDPEIHLTLDSDGGFNWSDLGPAPPQEESAPPSDAPAFRVAVQRATLGAGVVVLTDDGDEGLPDLRLSLGSLALEDLVLERSEPGGALRWGLGGADASEWSLDVAPAGTAAIDLDVAARTGAIGPDGWIPIELDLSRKDGIELELDGRLQPSPVELEASVRWAHLRSRAIAPLVDASALEIEGGTSSGHVQVSLSLAEGPDRGLSLAGEIDHDALEARSPDGRTELEVARIETRLAKLRVPLPVIPMDPPEPITADWSSIEIRGPALTLVVEDAEPGQDAGGGDEENSPGLVLRAQRLSVHDGRVLLRGPGLSELGGALPLQPFERMGPRRLPELRLDVGRFGANDVLLEPDADDGFRWDVREVEAEDWRLGLSRGDEAFVIVFTARTGAASEHGWIPFAAEGRREGGAHVDFDGRVRPHPIGVEGVLEWRDLESRVAAPLTGLVLAIESGRSSGQVSLELDLADSSHRGLSARGRATHHDLDLVTPDGRTRLRVADFEGQLLRLFVPLPKVEQDPPDPAVLHWSRVSIRDALVDYTFAEELGGDEGPPPAVSILADEVSVSEGVIRVRDETLPGFERTLSDASLEAKALRWPDLAFQHADFRAGGLGSEPARIEGSWARGQAKLQLRARRIALPPWNPVIVHYTDYSVDRGSLSIDSEFRLRGESYEAPTRLVLQSLLASAEGRGFQTRYGTSIERAIPLLADSAGSIHLDFVIRGQLSEGRPDLGPAFRTAFREGLGNALSNAALVAPMDITGSVLRRVGEVFQLGVGEALFDPGEVDLKSDARTVTLSAARLFTQRGGAGLELVPQIVSDDLRALGIDSGGDDLFGSIVAKGRAVLGGGRGAAEQEQAPAHALAKLRTEALTRYLVAEAGISASRIRAQPWDGTVREGVPRVQLRIAIRQR